VKAKSAKTSAKKGTKAAKPMKKVRMRRLHAIA
jgi:hypothetical protein